ncbi:UMTA [Aspergillus rambellii]|uniref:UMTA n=1 Tax=Aspergillus rambellii TaxID=308745 RepID=A0A0F8WRW2_9EURO|nr:UMTA [Aspergillus rambellii]
MVASDCEGHPPASGSHISHVANMPPEMLYSYGSGEREREDALTDTDSAYGEDSLLGDDTKSLSTYITDYRYEFGRRYHSYRDGAYWGPNDEVANALVDLAHHMYFLTLDGKLHLAPIENPQEILDVGTGTGIWAIDMADEYPSARVTGVDLSPIQPSFVPPNCIFEIDDVTLPWTYASDSFDFIHIREMFGCVPDWDEFFRQCWRCLKPGGYIEVVEHSVQPIADDNTMGPDHFYHLWGQTVVESGQRFGKSFTIWEESATRLKAVGFVDVVEKHYHWPVNGWSSDPKMHELGRWNQFRLNGGVEGFMLRLLTSTLQWSYERSQLFLAQMRSSLRDYKTHAYLPGTVVYARKPESAGSWRDQ